MSHIRGYDGSGLGLSISNELVKLLWMEKYGSNQRKVEVLHFISLFLSGNLYTNPKTHFSPTISTFLNSIVDFIILTLNFHTQNPFFSMLIIFDDRKPKIK